VEKQQQQEQRPSQYCLLPHLALRTTVVFEAHPQSQSQSFKKNRPPTAANTAVFSRFEYARRAKPRRTTVSRRFEISLEQINKK
jgi:hypothetical protein